MTKVTHLTLDDRGGLNRRRIHLREISGDTDTPLETVGQHLRAARLRRGDDLAAVSRTLKIRKDHLEAIEEDRLEDLPGRTYAVGFVRSYADYLGLDPVQCVERFKNEIGGRGEPSAPIGLIEVSDDRQLPHGWIVIAVVVLAIVAYGAYQLARSADTLLKQPVAPVPARIAPPPLVAFHAKPSTGAGRSAVIQTRLPSPAGATSLASAAVKPPSVPSHAEAAQRAPAPAATQASSDNAAPLRPQPAPGPQLASLSEGQVLGIQNKDARVILHAKLETHVLVRGADGIVFINRILHPGDSYRVPDRVGLTLTTPDGGAVGLELDGQVMGTAGATGQAADQLSLDPQAIVDRYSGDRPG